MKIALLEPIGVPDATLDALAADLKKRGHEFVRYAQKAADSGELIARSAGWNCSAWRSPGWTM